MIWVVRSLLAILFLNGVLRWIALFRSGTPLFIERGQPWGKQRLIPLGIFNILFSVFGFFLLETNGAEPLDILFGGGVSVLIFEVTFRKGAALPVK
jgi:hypothetical protein